MVRYILIGLFLVSRTLFAGDVVGNGGDIVYCEEQNTTELLDYYEGRVLRGYKPDLGDPTLAPEKKVELVLKRLEKIDYDRAVTFRKWLNRFWEDAKLIKDSEFIDIPDSSHIVIPRGCEIKQIAILTREYAPHYFINEDLWKLLSNDDKAGLILHEIIYRHADDHQNSKHVRVYNALISSKTLQMMDRKSYQDLLIKFYLRYYFHWKDPETQKSWRWGNPLIRWWNPNYIEDCEEMEGFRKPTFSEIEVSYRNIWREMSLQNMITDGRKEVCAGLENPGDSYDSACFNANELMGSRLSRPNHLCLKD